MTVAVVSGASRAVAAGGTRAGAAAGARSRPVTHYRGATSAKPARKQPSESTKTAGGAAAGSGLGSLLGKSAPGKALSSRSPLMPGSSARRLLLAEFAACMVIVSFSPMTDEKRTEGPRAFMVRSSAVMGVFFVLGLISTAGRGASRAAAGFGGLLTVALLVSSRSVFVKLAERFNSASEEGDQADEHEGLFPDDVDPVPPVSPDPPGRVPDPGVPPDPAPAPGPAPIPPR